MNNSQDESTPDINTVRSCYLRRDGLRRIYDKPYLEEYTKMMFVKISTGTDRKGRTMYNLAQIEGVTETPSKYRFFDGVTDKAFIIRTGLRNLTCRFDLLSNSSVTNGELKEWLGEFRKIKHKKKEWMRSEIEKTQNRFKMNSKEKNIFFKKLEEKWMQLSVPPSKRKLIEQKKKAEKLRNNYVQEQTVVKPFRNITRELISLRNQIETARMEGNTSECNRLIVKEKSLRDISRKRTLKNEDDSETVIKRMTKTWEDLDINKDALESQIDPSARKDTKSLVTRFGEENQRLEFQKMEKEIETLRAKRSKFDQKSKLTPKNKPLSAMEVKKKFLSMAREYFSKDEPFPKVFVDENGKSNKNEPKNNGKENMKGNESVEEKEKGIWDLGADFRFKFVDPIRNLNFVSCRRLNKTLH